jgi:preprotein translocase subunit SecA
LLTKEGFGMRTLVQWANAKFDLRLVADDLKNLRAADIVPRIRQAVTDKYNQREIEYPVEFAMSMAYGPQGVSVYGFQGLAEWANRRFLTNMTPEHLQDTKPQTVYKELLELSRRFHESALEEEIRGQLSSIADRSALVRWANQRFDAKLTEADIPDLQHAEQILLDAGREFFRRELGSLERYVLLQIFDSVWKDHLYAMDHLKDSIFLRSFAEKDPKIEYKQEGFRMFEEMLEAIEDRVTNIIFRVRLEAGAKQKNVWNVSHTHHDEVGQFAAAERQRAAATAPQGEQKVKTIRSEEPKVGRNDPCPCGSGKKYKKCHGKNA